jgi:hypothetical protein
MTRQNNFVKFAPVFVTNVCLLTKRREQRSDLSLFHKCACSDSFSCTHVCVTGRSSTGPGSSAGGGMTSKPLGFTCYLVRKERKGAGGEMAFNPLCLYLLLDEIKTRTKGVVSLSLPQANALLPSCACICIAAYVHTPPSGAILRSRTSVNKRSSFALQFDCSLQTTNSFRWCTSFVYHTRLTIYSLCVIECAVCCV